MGVSLHDRNRDEFCHWRRVDHRASGDGCGYLVAGMTYQPVIAAAVIWLNTGLPQLIQWCFS